METEGENVIMDPSVKFAKFHAGEIPKISLFPDPLKEILEFLDASFRGQMRIIIGESDKVVLFMLHRLEKTTKSPFSGFLFLAFIALATGDLYPISERLTNKDASFMKARNRDDEIASSRYKILIFSVLGLPASGERMQRMCAGHKFSYFVTHFGVTPHYIIK